MVDVAIVTIKREEFDALLEVFSEAAAAPTQALDAKYRFRTFRTGGLSWTVAITRCFAQGNGEAQSVVEGVITDLQPSLVLLVGIAGAPPTSDLFLGDVVLGTHIHDFNLGAETAQGHELAERGFRLRSWVARYVANLDLRSSEYSSWFTLVGERPEIPTVLEFVDPADETWNRRISEAVTKQRTRKVPKVVDGPIASSDDLLKVSAALKQRLGVDRQILAVEMEAAGSARACESVDHGEKETAFLPIRSISDIVGLKRDSAWEIYACRAAARFAATLLENLPPHFLAKAKAEPPLHRQVVQTVKRLYALDKAPIPASLIASALSVDETRLKKELQADIAAGEISWDGAGLAAGGSDTAAAWPEGAAFLESFLEHLLVHIKDRDGHEDALIHLRGAAELAISVLPRAPYLARCSNFQVSGEPIFGDSGRYIGYRGIGMEVTERFGTPRKTEVPEADGIG